MAIVVVDADIIPLQSRIARAADDPDLREVVETERHLLYVACTRARDHLLVTSANTPLERLDDLMLKKGGGI